jgi:hypothetical protein
MVQARHLSTAVVAAAAIGIFAIAGTAQAEMMKFKAALTGASEVPANAEKGTGQATLDFDSVTKVLTYTVSYTGLTGPATVAHIHGPAAVGANAPPIIPFSNVQTSPIKGTATLNDAQVASLTSGMLYVNVHTAAHPGGEIRGQIVK